MCLRRVKISVMSSRERLLSRSVAAGKRGFSRYYRTGDTRFTRVSRKITGVTGVSEKCAANSYLPRAMRVADLGSREVGERVKESRVHIMNADNRVQWSSKLHSSDRSPVDVCAIPAAWN